jgi:hypothetical protein
MRKIWGWNQRRVKSYFFKKFETNYHSSSSYVFYMLFYFWCTKKFAALQFVHPITQNSLNLVKELKIYWKMFNDKYMFDDGQLYPIPKNSCETMYI